MADEPLKYSDLVQDDAINKFKTDFASIEPVIATVTKELNTMAQASAKLFGGKVVNITDLKNEQKGIADINSAYQAKIVLEEKLSAIRTQEFQEKIKLRNANTEELKAKKAEIAANAEANKIAKLNAIVDKEAAGSLNQKKAQLALVTIQVNKMSEAELKGTKAGQELVATQKRLTDQIGKTEQAGGNFHRQVGHYEIGLKKLGLGIKGATGLLGELGSAFGLDTEYMERFMSIGKTVAKTLKEIHHVEGLAGHAKKENIALTEEQIVVEQEHATTLEAEKVAQEASNKAALANPYLLLAAGIIGLIGIIGAYIYVSGEAKKREEERSKAIDGTIIKDKALRESHNASIYALQRLNVEYKLITGSINSYRAEIENATIDTNEQLTKLTEDTNEKLTKAEGFWNQFGDVFVDIGHGRFWGMNSDEVMAYDQEILDINENTARQRKDILDKADAELKNLHAKHLKEMAEMELKASQDLGKQTRRLNDETIVNKRQRDAQLLKDDAMEAITEVENSKATEQAKGEARTAIWKSYRFKLGELQKQWREDDLAAEKKQNQALEKLYIEDRDAKVKAEKEKYELIERLKKLHTENSPEQSPIEKENKWYDDAKSELESIRSAAIKKGVYTKEAQEKLDAELQEIEIHHQYEVNKIFGDMRHKTDAEIDKANKERIEKEKKEAEQHAKFLMEQDRKVVDAFKKGIQEQYAAQEKELQRQNSIISDDMQIQAKLFAEGLDNTLAYDLKAKADNQKKEIELAKKSAQQKKAAELASAMVSTYTSLVKAGEKPQKAMLDAFTSTLAVEGLADGLTKAFGGNFAEGIENFKGKGNGTSDSNIIGFSHGESVVKASATAETKGLVSAINADGFDGATAWAFDNIFNPVFASSIASDSIGGRSNPDYVTSIALNMKRSVEQGIVNGMKKVPTQKIELDALGQIIDRQFENGIQKSIILHGRVC